MKKVKNIIEKAG